MSCPTYSVVPGAPNSVQATFGLPNNQLTITGTSLLDGFGSTAGSILLVCGNNTSINLRLVSWTDREIVTVLPDSRPCIPDQQNNYHIQVQKSSGELCPPIPISISDSVIPQPIDLERLARLMRIEAQLPAPPPPGQPELPEPIFAKLIAPNISGVIFTDQQGNTLPVYSDPHAFVGAVTEDLSPAPHKLLSPIVSDLPSVTVVKVEICWNASRVDGTSTKFLVKPDLSAPLDANTQVANVVFLFKPNVVELTKGNLRTAPRQRRQIHIKVRLSVDNIFTTGWIDLPYKEVPIPSLQIPTVLALCQGINLLQSVLILVPTSSPFESVAGLRSFLERLNVIVYALKEIGSFASFLLGLDSLVNILPSVGGSNYVVTDDILLDDISFEPGATWEDRASSMLFIGPQDKWVHCQNESHKDEEGSLIITIGEEYHVIVPTLRENPPRTLPVNRRIVNRQPTDDDPGEHSYLFDDTLSTIIFSPPIPAVYVNIVGSRSIRLSRSHVGIGGYTIDPINLDILLSVAWSSNGSVVNPAYETTNISFVNTGTCWVQVDVTDINHVHVQNRINVIVEEDPRDCHIDPPICCTHPNLPVCERDR
ncbi:hypothetical protein [Paenibacillus alvei]|uniref:IPT/TIG domain-containing protein n=1 Tax=Paenibacillus alvei TaxID=44250 RepID=A0A383R3M1_PAEAL|nr:hypothetical protein [Paenibacillus alvei]SYX81725.1 conserved protein of unknown function [Paenibacillus alvei]